ncbi:hypothetical protein KC19_VG103300 [Ceratodon purpureus]|uniref:Uncharacterized protein n=1 Tax=Ceratodon purpureus TaxID=3225 RepID=A0A8T0HNU4_CERPU|nr:hypothetical protein KC19_VG103300 [Ceratodon purpureus]
MDSAGSLMVQWHNFKMVAHRRTRARKEKKVLRMNYQNTPAPVYLDYLTYKLRPFTVDNYIIKWKVEQFKCIGDTLWRGG